MDDHISNGRANSTQLGASAERAAEGSRTMIPAGQQSPTPGDPSAKLKPTRVSYMA